MVKEAVEDLLEQQPPGGDRERYSLISCFRELPSVTRQYDRPICGSNVQCPHDNHTECDISLCVDAQAHQKGQHQHYHFATQPQRLLAPNPEGIGSDDGASFPSISPVLDMGEEGPMPTSLSPPVSSSAAQSSILGLPPDVLEGIMSRLDPLDLARLRAACRVLAEAGAEGGVVPGVRLTLFPHQRAAVRWMIQRECGGPPTHGSHRAGHTILKTAGQPAPMDSQYCQKYQKHHQRHQNHHHQQQPTGQSSRHPMFVELACGSRGELMLWVDIQSGGLQTLPPPALPDVRGGFFCDEPGLGKTITALSLILKTLGQLPVPPPGAAVEWVPNREGRRVGFYTMGGPADHPAPTDPLPSPQSASATPVAETIPSPLRQRQQKLQPQQGGAQPSPRGAEVLEVETAGAAATAVAVAHSPPQSPLQPSSTTAQQKRRCSGTGRSPARRTNTNKGCSAGSGGSGRGGVRSSAAGTRRATTATPAAVAEAAAEAAAEAGSKRKRRSRRSSFGGLETKKPDGDDSEGRRSVEEEIDEGEGGDCVKRPQRPRRRLTVKRRLLGSSQEEEHESVSSSDREGEGHKGRRGGTADRDDDSDYEPRSAKGRGGQGRERRRVPVGGTGDERKTARGGHSTEKIRTTGNGGGKDGGGGGKDGGGGGKDGGGGGKDGGGDTGDTGEEKMEEGDVEATWVQCDQCRAWRKLPEGTPVPEGDDAWFCHMHPLPEAASCTAPREAFGEETLFDDAPGYMRPDGSEAAAMGGTRANVIYFTTTLRSAAARLGLDPREIASLEALRWLTRQDPVELKSDGSGVMVPAAVRQISYGYDTVFQSLDLVNLADAGNGGGSSHRRRPGSRYASSTTSQHTWRAAPYMGMLLLDTEALVAALTELRSCPSGPCRTYLSAATLVVLPSTLIDHWLLQIRTHVARGALRVCVLDRIGPGVATSPSSLAWDYDIVITTFQHLSLGRPTHGSAAAEWAPPAAGNGGGCAGWLQVLLQIHWLRVILDEGHLLGASTAITNKRQAACKLTADRRWVMTGTPTPAAHGSSAAHLQPLLAFLHHEPYGSS
ncbi:hypothetical protein Vretifemale_19608, partial [Volvox reticuliferus]